MLGDSKIGPVNEEKSSNSSKEATSKPRNKRLGYLESASIFGWMSSVLPFNIAIGPMSTLVQLLILNFNGTVIEVGLAITLFNAVSIPAALFWGFVTDRFQRRRYLIVISFLGTSLILVLFLFARTSYWLSFLYALFSFITTASTTPLNLLVIETERKSKWASAFAKFSMISSVGQTFGLLLGMLWSVYLSLDYLVLPLSILSLVSAALAGFLIREPKIVFDRKILVMHKPSFFYRLRHSPYFFLRIPHLNSFRRIFRNLHYELTRHTPLLYLAIFVFFLSAGIFNTSLVPALEANGIPSLLIFSVIMLGLVVQILSFKFAGPYIEQKSLIKTAVWGLVLRAIGYSALGIFAYFLTGMWLLIPILIFYPLSSGIAYSIYYTSSNTLVFNTLSPGRNGSNLGVYSALAGIATMGGSLISGFLSFYLGFYITFLVSATFLGVSAWLLSLAGSSHMSVDSTP